ncbi:hypothetical protein KAT95_00035 [Candidatus Parcubacteria bacterium]|nr:hypothetical protein [Candidatus Parcubacteria bacterium]
MFFLKKKKNQEIELEKRKKDFFSRFCLTYKAVFLFSITFSILLFAFSFCQALDPIEEGISISAVVEGVAPPPSAGGGPILQSTVVFNGKAYPGALVTILRNGSIASTLTADSSAEFSATLTGIPSGFRIFSLWAEDKEGKKSPTLSFSVYLTNRTSTTFAGLFLAPTINLSSFEISKGEVLDIYGYTAPKAEVNIFINNGSEEIVLRTKSDTDGFWLYSLDTSIIKKAGYSVRARSTSSTGEISMFSESLDFEVLPEGIAVCCGADINCDNRIDIVDFSIMLFWWESKEIKDPCVDINLDNEVNLVDFSIMLYYWTG